MLTTKLFVWTNPHANPKWPLWQLNRVKTPKKELFHWGGIWTWRVSLDGQHATAVATEHDLVYESKVLRSIVVLGMSHLYDVMSLDP